MHNFNNPVRSTVWNTVASFGMLLSSVVIIPPCMAQTLPDIPRPQTAGELGQVYMPVVEQQGALGIAPNTDEELPELKTDGFHVIEQRLLEALEKQKALTFTTVQFEGDALVKQALDLTPYQNTPLTLEQLNKLAKQVDDLASKPHHLERISFEVDDTFTTLTVKAVVQHLGKVLIEGNKHIRTSALERQLLGHQTPEDLLNIEQLNKRLRMIQDNPDIQLEPVLEPVEGTNQVNVRVKVIESRPVHLSAFWNNLDQTYYGNMLTGATTVINNVTGNTDTLMVTPITDTRTHGVYAHYEIPLNAHGTRFGIDFANIRANPTAQGFEEFHIKGRYWGVTTSLYQTLIAKANFRVNTDLNLDVRQAKTVSKFASLDTDEDGTDEIYTNTEIENERLRDIRWGINLQKIGKKNEFSTRQEITVGLPIANATLNSASNLGNVGGGSQFFRYITNFYYKHALPWQTALVLNASGQWSPGTLSSADLGGIGGTYFGRGYPEAFLQADSLIFASAEYRTPLFFAPKKWIMPFSDGMKLRDSVQLLTFVDYGFAKNNNRSLVDDPNACVASVGGGVRFELSKFVTGRVDIGVPLVKQALPAYNHYGPRVHFGLAFNAF